MDEIRGWYTRDYLPHFDGGTITQSVTFHLEGCFSTALLRRWEDRLILLPKEDREREKRRLIERHLDLGEGDAWLRDPFLANLVETALLFFDGQRYYLHAWVVMPNHVHTLFTPMPGNSLESITHSWKSFTSHEANKYLKRHGDFWFTESYDRYIRDEQHYANALQYIENNPVKAGLCATPEAWRWSSAWWRYNALR